jgi:AraC family transcriptional regulator
MVPATMPFAVRRDRQGRIVVTLLSPRLVDEIATDARLPVRPEMRPLFRARDPLLNELLLALSKEVLADNPAGPLYAETLGAAVAAQLLHRHSRGARERPGRGGLGSRKFRLVSDYVEAHLGEPIRLRELAGIAGMSTFQLAHRFKETAGLPPHQYVTRRRIERAKELLRQANSSVIEVALACGFASPSHFAQVFRLLTGVTPRSYRGASEL